MLKNYVSEIEPICYQWWEKVISHSSQLWLAIQGLLFIFLIFWLIYWSRKDKEEKQKKESG